MKEETIVLVGIMCVIAFIANWIGVVSLPKTRRVCTFIHILALIAIFAIMLTDHYSAKEFVYDPPEEIQAISVDSNNPDLLVGYREGNTIHLGYKH